MNQVKISIGGMSCGHCVGQVTKALAQVDGVRVENVKVGEAAVAYDPATTSEDRIARAIEDQGYVVRR